VIYQFGDFELNKDGFCLTENGRRIPLEPKALSVLLVLVSRAGFLVDKRLILELVWDGTFVEENTLTRTIAVLRRELGDRARDSRFIETIPTRGYRFIAPVVTSLEQVSTSPQVSKHAPKPPVLVAARRTMHRPHLLIGAGAIALIVFGLAAWSFHSQPKSEAMLPSNPIPLTTYQGSENAPSLSPDGNQVAFEWNSEKQDKFDIYVKAVGSDTTLLRLTNAPNPSRHPSWSPDGRTIAFERIVSPGKLDLMLISALGGPERKLAEFRSTFDQEGYTPTWSANSKWLVFPAMTDSGSHLLRISVESGETAAITSPPLAMADTNPSISPDGNTLVFDRHGAFNGGSLYTMRIDADAKPISPTALLFSGTRYWQARWTENSKEIITHLVSEPTYSAVRIRVDGSSAPQRVVGVSSNGLFDIARKGNRFVFATLHGDTNIWRIDLTTRPLRPAPFISSTIRDVSPEYSPDGRRLAFHSNRSGTGTQIWISDNDGKQAQQITFMQGGITASPHWSPDGQSIVFDSSSSGHFQIYTTSANGGKAIQRTHGDSDSFGGTWSRDGRWLYYTSNKTGRNELWKVSVNGGSPIPVTRNGGTMAIESQDGRTLYYSKESGNGSIWKMPTAGGPEQQLTDSLFRTNFAVIPTGIYFMTAPGINGTSKLGFYSFGSGAITTVLPIGLPEYGLAVSPDGRYLLYDQLDNPASDLMLVENFH